MILTNKNQEDFCIQNKDDHISNSEENEWVIVIGTNEQTL